MPDTLVDNDIIWKLCRYGLLGDLASSLKRKESDLGVLGSMRFVIGDKVKKLKDEACSQDFAAFLDKVNGIEPSEKEIAAAAEIEEMAIKNRLAIDGGESLILAIASGRSGCRVVTGDKRAILGIAELAKSSPSCATLRGLIVTLEWVIDALIQLKGYDVVRATICAANKVDMALSICFHCHRDKGEPEVTADCLASYQKHLAKETGDFVTPDLGGRS